MIIGITGTRHGLTDAQIDTAMRMVKENAHRITNWHQGGCVGADWQVSTLLWIFTDATQEVWPGLVNDKWKYDWSDFDRTLVHEDRKPLVRNEIIVNSVNWLWAFPDKYPDPGRGGTWHTIRHADKRAVNYDVIDPDGVRHCTGTWSYQA